MNADDLPNISDEALADLAQRARRMVNAYSAGELADLGVARYEIDSDASDRVLMRNMALTQRARNTLSQIEAEIARRKDRP